MDFESKHLPFDKSRILFGEKTAPKEKRSFFLVTANTNYRPDDTADAEEVAEELNNAAQKVIGDSDSVGNFMEILILDHSWSSEFIKKIRVKTSVEIGHRPRGRRMHLHALIKVLHSTKLHVNINKLKKLLNEELETVQIAYINVKLVSAVDDYMEKDD